MCFVVTCKIWWPVYLFLEVRKNNTKKKKQKKRLPSLLWRPAFLARARRVLAKSSFIITLLFYLDAFVSSRKASFRIVSRRVNYNGRIYTMRFVSELATSNFDTRKKFVVVVTTEERIADIEFFNVETLHSCTGQEDRNRNVSFAERRLIRYEMENFISMFGLLGTVL